MKQLLLLLALLLVTVYDIEHGSPLEEVEHEIVTLSCLSTYDVDMCR